MGIIFWKPAHVARSESGTNSISRSFFLFGQRNHHHFVQKNLFRFNGEVWSVWNESIGCEDKEGAFTRFGLDLKLKMGDASFQQRLKGEQKGGMN